MGHILLSWCTCYVVRGRALGVHHGRATHSRCVLELMWGRGPRGNSALAQLSADFQSLPPLPTIKLGTSGADSRVDGLVYVLEPRGSLQWV